MSLAVAGLYTANEISIEKQMYEMADFFLSFHTPNTTDYTKKYLAGNYVKEENNDTLSQINLEDTPLYKELRQYRYEISKAASLKPYMVFTSAEMVNIIYSMPKTLNDLKKIPGFGEVKCQRYGNCYSRNS